MEDYQSIFLYTKVQITELMLNVFDELPKSTYTRNIHQIFITTPSMFKNYSKHVHEPMNGQVIATPFWFASVGNGSSIMTLWKEVVVKKLSGEFCLTEILLEKNRKSGRNLKMSPLQTIKLNKTWSRGIFDIMLFSRNSVCSFFFFYILQRSWVFIYTAMYFTRIKITLKKYFEI